MFKYRHHTHAYKDLMCMLKELCCKVGLLWMSLLEMDSWEAVESLLSLLRHGASSILFPMGVG